MLFCCNKDPDKIESMASLLILGGAIPLAGAMIAQFGYHLPPCDFCLYQRYPYLLMIAAGVASLFLRPRGVLCWRVCVALGFWALLLTGTLGLLHTSIEEGWLHYGGGCVAQAPADNSLEALRSSIMAAPLVSCDTPMARVLGLTMASWNALWALFIGVAMALQYQFETRRHAHR